MSQPRRATCCSRTRALRWTRGPPCGWIARGGASFRCSATVLTACCRSSPSCTLASSTGRLCARRRRRTETASSFTVRPGRLCDGARRSVTAASAESAGARGTDGERVSLCCCSRTAGLCFGGVCSPCGGQPCAPPLASLIPSCELLCLPPLLLLARQASRHLILACELLWPPPPLLTASTRPLRPRNTAGRRLSVRRQLRPQRALRFRAGTGQRDQGMGRGRLRNVCRYGYEIAIHRDHERPAHILPLPGEKRKLKIPAEKGYGERGSPPKIPGGASLVFVRSLLDECAVYVSHRISRTSSCSPSAPPPAPRRSSKRAAAPRTLTLACV